MDSVKTDFQPVEFVMHGVGECEEVTWVMQQEFESHCMEQRFQNSSDLQYTLMK